MAHSDSRTDASQEWTGEATLPPQVDFLQPSTYPGSIGRLAHYEVFKILGKGSYGIVLKALDTKLQRDVAIKMLSFEFGPTSTAHARFVREARAAATISHENVVQIYAVEDLPKAYLVMEYVAGETLQDLLDRERRLAVPDVLSIGAQVARGLAAAHEKGLIHRDLKPGNILIRKVGDEYQAKLADFGLALSASDARLTQSGMVAGTPLFMAPEQARGEPLDHRTDLFSLGSVLYMLTTGSVPFGATDGVAVMNRIAWGEPVPIRKLALNTPQWLCDIIAKLHARKPADRYQSAKEVADVLTKALHNPPPDRALVPSNRRLLIGGGIAAAVLAGAAAAFFVFNQSNDSKPPVEPKPPVAETPKPDPKSASSAKHEIADRFASPDYAWTKPAKLKNVNTPGRDLSAALTTDEKVIVFSRGLLGMPGTHYTSRREQATDDFAEPVELTDAVNNESQETATLSGDGLRMIYVAKRDRPAEQVWEVTRKRVEDDFSDPKPLVLSHEPQGFRRSPLLSADGRTLLVTILAGKDGVGIHVFQRDTVNEPFKPGVALPPTVNQPGIFTIASWLSPDGRVLIVGTIVNRKNVPRYHVRGADGEFGPGTDLLPWGENVGVGRPWFTPDGLTMYFHSREIEGSEDLDIYVSRLEPKKK